jgi:hypothetical protein
MSTQAPNPSIERTSSSGLRPAVCAVASPRRCNGCKAGVRFAKAMAAYGQKRTVANA